MTSIGELKAAIAGIPDLHALIIGARGDTLAIRGPSHTVYTVSVACIGELKVTTAGIPDLCGIIIRPRGDALAIGGPGHTGYIGGMTSIGEQITATAGIPAPARSHQLAHEAMRFPSGDHAYTHYLLQCGRYR